MDRPRRRRLRPEARKQEIVEAAERLLQAHGARVRVEDVVREAGVAKGTFFLYFPSWDDLLETVRNRLAAEFDAAYPMPAETDGPVDWLSVLDRLAGAYIDFASARQGIGQALFHSDFTERRPPGDHAIVRLTAIIRAGQAAGAFGPVDPEPAARLLYAAIDEAPRAVAGGMDRDAMTAALRHLLRRTLAPPNPASQKEDPMSETQVNVRYMVGDVPQTVDWYVGHFGFSPVGPASPAFAAVQRGPVRLLLSGKMSSAGRPMPDGRQPEPGGWNRLQLVFEDLAAEVERLRARGVSFRNAILTGPGGSQILAEDPSGNVVELFQPAALAAAQAGEMAKAIR